MKWLAKAVAFKAFSSIPGGSKLYRHAQTHWTKSIVATPERVGQKMEIGMSYLSWLFDHGHDLERIRDLRHLDLGCGWHPSIPLMYSRIGLRRQVLTDVTHLMCMQTFRESEVLVDRLLSARDHSAHDLLRADAEPAGRALASLDDLLASNDMEYHAPYFDWVSTAGQSMDLATCTQVLMHIERPILDEVFKAVHGLLKAGGLFMSTVHLFDIYSNSDRRISIYNHLRYSKGLWSKLVNSDMMTFNRFKARDYREALEAAGFEIVAFEIEHGGPDDLRALRAVKVHPEFAARYSEEELADKHLFFVARKP